MLLAAMPGRGRTHPGDGFPDLGVRLTPQRIDVGVLAGDLDGGVGRAAEIHRQMRRLDRLDGREGALEAIVLPGIVEGLRTGPRCLDHIEVFARAGIALVLGEEVAILPEFLIVAAGDDVNAGPAIGEMIEGGELAGGDGRGSEPGPVGDHQIDALGHRSRISRNLLAFRRGGMEGDEKAVEAAIFLRLGESPDVVAIDDRSLGGMSLRLVVGADKANELDVLAHG